MSCPASKRLCNKLIISDSVTFVDDTLLIDIPQGNYGNHCKYCIVVAQALPDETTINAPVAITIGGDTTTTYPLINTNGTNVLARSINTRTRYSVCVFTDIATGVFRLIGRIACSTCPDSAPSLPIATTAVAAGT